ncbi:hypothetical protein H2509_13385 [Stappia sp. F7233]|uniref:Uncharacterized protein n=1 Tax=Stappia albiluteola TaxID=2758565 RepID=A0A839ACV1_9HYPH|nr:hypothetical protein [Stappia albiluteola]MBA5777445.1 hypothetical protein [Stappia albiluteola]MBA5777483.1 hypothetical protein [Stappia albiluteola]MBA5778106.1 hypothetical protein [Stappia albiluteola]MBA5778117.1 hypothetical protein [Stappia albiluteola]
MLSEDIRTLRQFIDEHVSRDGSLFLSPALTELAKFALADMVRCARALETAQVSGPARITEADLASGRVARLPVVPRPRLATGPGNGSSA